MLTNINILLSVAGFNRRDQSQGTGPKSVAKGCMKTEEWEPHCTGIGEENGDGAGDKYGEGDDDGVCRVEGLL